MKHGNAYRFGSAFDNDASFNFGGAASNANVKDASVTCAGVLNSATHWAFAFWFKTGFSSPTFMDTRDNNFEFAKIRLLSGQMQVTARYNSGGGLMERRTVSTFNDSVWRHCIVRISHSGGSAILGEIWINGVLQSYTTSTNGGGSPRTPFISSRLVIGNNVNNNGGPAGLLDQFAFYTGSIDAYVSEIYNGGSVVDLNSLSITPRAWYRMDNADTLNSSLGIIDSSGNGFANTSNVNVSKSADVP